MFNMSPLKKIMITGADAAAVLNHLTTREINNVSMGQASYLSVLTEQGTMADDAIVYNNGNNEWMIVHGSGDTMNLLDKSAAEKTVEIHFTDTLHNVSVQGSNSLSVLNALCDSDLATLAYLYDMSTEHTPYEVSLGFTVTKSKSGYRGCEALAAAKGHEKIKIICLDIEHTDIVIGTELLTFNGQAVGVVNSPCYSNRLGKSLALANVKLLAGEPGTACEWRRY
jgi:glycine cleavage system aminomethyltransferase T